MIEKTASGRALAHKSKHMPLQTFQNKKALFMSSRRVVSGMILAASFIFSVLTTPAYSINTISKYQVKTVIHESLLNEYFSSLTPLTEKGSIDGAIVKNKYEWTVNHLTAHIHKQMIMVKADISMKVGEKANKTSALGTLNISYDKHKHQIDFKVSNLTFDMFSDVYGNDLKIKTITLNDYFTPSFSIQGPVPTTWKTTTNLKDSHKKTLSISPVSFEYVVGDQVIEILAKYEYFPNLH